MPNFNEEPAVTYAIAKGDRALPALTWFRMVVESVATGLPTTVWNHGFWRKTANNSVDLRAAGRR